MPKETPFYSDRNYSVTAPNGYRKGGMSEDEAQTHAAALNQQMRENGWRGKAEVYYRDGSLVPAKKVG